jgi:chaperonin GroES
MHLGPRGPTHTELALTRTDHDNRHQKESLMTTIKPLDDRIVLEVLDAEEKTAGGIVLPDTAREKPQRGKVAAVGTGRLLKNGTRVPVSLKVGDEVIFGKYAGTEVTIDEVEFKILRESEVLARCS